MRHIRDCPDAKETWFQSSSCHGYIGASMRLFYAGKDGGKDSTCWGFWLIELKSLFSIVGLKFVGNSREAYHTHAFTSVSWLISGQLIEEFTDGTRIIHKPSLLPIVTRKYPFHKVSSKGNSYVLSIRGPWENTWFEQTEHDGRYRLTHGRKKLSDGVSK